MSTGSSGTCWLGGNVLDYVAGGPGFDPGTALDYCLFLSSVFSQKISKYFCQTSSHYLLLLLFTLLFQIYSLLRFVIVLLASFLVSVDISFMYYRHTVLNIA